MKKWRVGTISMGVSLLLLGILLLVSSFQGYQVFESFIAWWPSILIILGIEILLYQVLSNKEESFVKYDFLSVIFVGIIGTVGIGFTLLFGSGLLHEVRAAVGATNVSTELPSVLKEIPSTVKNVVVDASNYPLTIESTSSNEIRMFGTYETFTNKDSDKLELEKYASFQNVGDTLYIQLKDLKQNDLLFHGSGSMELTVLVPENLSLEVRGAHNPIEVWLHQLKNNWIVKDAGSLEVNIEEETDVTLSALAHRDELEGNAGWTTIEKKVESPYGGYDESGTRKATFVSGDGTYNLQALNQGQIVVNILK
jgi:hypothetical protein